MEKLKEFEEQQKQLEKIYKPINDKMEKLQKEEESLYNNIIENYPNIKQEDIVIQIQDYVKQKVG